MTNEQLEAMHLVLTMPDKDFDDMCAKIIEEFEKRTYDETVPASQTEEPQKRVLPASFWSIYSKYRGTDKDSLVAWAWMYQKKPEVEIDIRHQDVAPRLSYRIAQDEDWMSPSEFLEWCNVFFGCAGPFQPSTESTVQPPIVRVNLTCEEQAMLALLWAQDNIRYNFRWFGNTETGFTIVDDGNSRFMRASEFLNWARGKGYTR